MSRRQTLKFEVLRLREGPQHYQLEEPAALLELDDDPEFTFDEPVRLDLKLRLVSDSVLMEGTVETLVRAPCVRCLEELRLPVKARVMLVYMTDARLLEPDKYPEFQEENTHWYDGEMVYPGEMLRELLLVELPTLPACQLEEGDICPVRNVKVGPHTFGAGPPAEDKQPAAEIDDGDSLGAQLRKLRRKMN